MEMKRTPPPLNDISTIVRPPFPIPMDAELTIGTAFLRPIKAVLGALLHVLTYRQQKRRMAEEASRERWKIIRVHQWTKRMSEADALRFVLESNGGLLSGASFEKASIYIAQRKVDAMGPMSRSEKREQLQFFIENPRFGPENFVWR